MIPGNISRTGLAAWRAGSTVLLAVLFFFAVCFCSASTIKITTVVLILLTLLAIIPFFSKLKEQLGLPFLVLAMFVLMDGLSSIYAVSGKFALYEFLKVISAFCMALLLRMLVNSRKLMAVLEGCAAIAGLVSIDLLSTRFISTPVLALLGCFTQDYQNLTVVEEGIRMTSIFGNPNVFAGCVGIGVLLSLGLAVSAEKSGERIAHLIALFINATAFVLAFSMGACLAVSLAFITYLALERREQRIRLLLLMVGTLALTMLAVFPISLTSLTAWTGIRPVPLLCLTVGAALLCVWERMTTRLADVLSGYEKAIFIMISAFLAVLVGFVIVACLLTGGVDLEPGVVLRRAAYPAPGSYTMTAEADSDVTVSIESQNRADTMMHTSTELYSGPLSQAAFTVPIDSKVVYFNFSAGQPARLEKAGFAGEDSVIFLPLEYKLLPSFAANRIQGILANQNAMQRLVFFEDGLKIFWRSPLLGSGLGSFENGVKSVQSFYYVTKYAHNHYIQTLADTGLVGFALFLALLAVSAAAVRRGRRDGNDLASALGAALVFMVIHGSVELIFSSFPYLPMAFGVFTAIDLCGGMTRTDKQGVRSVVLLVGMAALLTVFGLLLSCNMIAQKIAAEDSPDLKKAIRLDRFEWADYMLSYVIRSSDPEIDPETRRQADEYAARLAELNSNTVPIYLAEYYFNTDRLELGLQMIEKYVNYVASDSAAWQEAFQLLERYETDSALYRDAVVRIAGMLDKWNEENLGNIILDESSEAFIARIRGE